MTTLNLLFKIELERGETGKEPKMLNELFKTEFERGENWKRAEGYQLMLSFKGKEHGKMC